MHTSYTSHDSRDGIVSAGIGGYSLSAPSFGAYANEWFTRDQRDPPREDMRSLIARFIYAEEEAGRGLPQAAFELMERLDRE